MCGHDSRWLRSQDFKNFQLLLSGLQQPIALLEALRNNIPPFLKLGDFFVIAYGSLSNCALRIVNMDAPRSPGSHCNYLDDWVDDEDLSWSGPEGRVIVSPGADYIFARVAVTPDLSRICSFAPCLSQLSSWQFPKPVCDLVVSEQHLAVGFRDGSCIGGFRFGIVLLGIPMLEIVRMMPKRFFGHSLSLNFMEGGKALLVAVGLGYHQLQLSVVSTTHYSEYFKYVTSNIDIIGWPSGLKVLSNGCGKEMIACCHYGQYWNSLNSLYIFDANTLRIRETHEFEFSGLFESWTLTFNHLALAALGQISFLELERPTYKVATVLPEIASGEAIIQLNFLAKRDSLLVLQKSRLWVICLSTFLVIDDIGDLGLVTSVAVDPLLCRAEFGQEADCSDRPSQLAQIGSRRCRCKRRDGR